MVGVFSRARRVAPVAILVVAAFLLPFLLSTQQESLLTRALIFGAMAASLDLAYGQAGLYSLGHAALAGVGGYTAGLLMVRYEVQSFWLLMLAVAGASAAASMAFALVSLRAKGLYFILVTLALGQMVANLAQQWDFLKTAQAEAVTGIVMPSLGFATIWNPGTVYQFVLVVVVVMLFTIQRIIGSPVGLALRGARENGVRMSALGYDVWRYRVAAIVLSGTLCGLSGALFAFHSGLIAPSNVGVAASGVLVLMAIIGGSGTRYGAFVGGVVVTLLQFYASEWSMERAPMIVGVLFILTALLIRFRPAAASALRGLLRGEASHASA
ncbi:MAG: branched-chain amino acid ABC transporter permease [Nocardioides sp.]|uniref:branched-chain amino acid ABC transporter permease n=1 Tax=Nocardioides sp. TaxID=35761 RepID=UPI003263BDFC